MQDVYVRETIKINRFVQVKVIADNNAEQPEDDLVKIAYLDSSRYCLGTEAVSHDRMTEIASKIGTGEYIGAPVYAYVHSGATIRMGQSFGDPWDSGCSGYAYAEADKIKPETPDPMAYIKAQVETFDQYLTGDVWGYVVQVRASEDDEWEDDDSCWGFFGSEYAKEEGKSAGVYVSRRLIQEKGAATRALKKEINETAYWAARDIMTVRA